MKKIISLLFVLLSCKCFTQNLGGNTVFNFLAQPFSPQVSALGGLNISNISNDVSLVSQNPALLRENMNGQINTAFNSFLAGIKNYSLTGAWRNEKAGANFALGVNYFNYGSITQTDAAGNILGEFKPNDYVLQFTVSKKYLDKWFYGANIKFAVSNYGLYKSSAVAADIGVNYYDADNHFQAGITFKNIGTQLKAYEGASKEELPFDLEIGVTKRLKNAPLQFSLTAHHLQAFNIYYNDTAFNASQGDDSYLSNKFTLQKIFSHLIFSTQLFIGEKLEVTAGYNFLRRFDLNAYNIANGLNGFTFGVGALFSKLHIRYAMGFYQKNLFHQFGLNFNLTGSDL
ncbi:MAG: type IX secretion system protein PorQ [Sphingobacteriia bacterium]|nr:type IX secretion system protein PorQ [Sphingobacteriia bacterium]